MTPTQRALWTKIQAFLLDDPASAYTFSDRLSSENGWSYEFALRAIEEYKRFMFLICISPYPQTPSDQIDQVWHLHLLYTESYWVDFCENTLGKRINHGPTKGGPTERQQYKDWYALTLALYADVFQHAPPADLWPENKQRFSDIHFERVNKRQHWIIKKPKFLW